jgi:uncharacterized protein (TIGR02996 family)
VTDEAAFIRAIIERPDDDLPRLVMADFLDERGDPRGEFIRLQVELAKLPPAHVKVTERCVLVRRYGPDYYALTGGEGTQDGPVIMRVKVGDRVDVLRPTSNKGKPMYGLRVHKITDDEVILVNDAKSGPWAGQALRRRERRFGVRAQCWVPQLAGWNTFQGDEPGVIIWTERGWRFTFTRGFVSAVTLSWADWSRHAAALLAACPLTGKDSLVRLTTWPEVEGEAGGNGRDMTLRLRGCETRRRLTEREAIERLAESGQMTFERLWGQRLRGELILELLAAEYPGVAFWLPEPRSVDGLTAREVADRMNTWVGSAMVRDATYRAIAADTPEARP